eukprot:753966-Hanusia_phi.AAC.4
MKFVRSTRILLRQVKQKEICQRDGSETSELSLQGFPRRMTTVKARSTCITRALLLLVALSFLTFSYAAKEDEKSETKTGGTKTGGTGKDMDIDSELRHLFTELMSLNHHRQIQDHENLFQMADKDSNGHIDRNEFEAFVRGNQDSMDNFQMRRHGPEHVFKRNDLDKDGSLNKREWARTSHMPHYMPQYQT